MKDGAHVTSPLHRLPPAPLNTLTRCLRNRVQATSLGLTMSVRCRRTHWRIRSRWRSMLGRCSQLVRLNGLRDLRRIRRPALAECGHGLASTLSKNSQTELACLWCESDDVKKALPIGCKDTRGWRSGHLEVGRRDQIGKTLTRLLELSADQGFCSNYGHIKEVSVHLFKFTHSIRGQGRQPGTEFLDAETGRQKPQPKCANAPRDQNPEIDWPEMPAETPYLTSCRKRAVCGDWMVGAPGLEPGTR
jgi:hypothetical protein